MYFKFRSNGKIVNKAVYICLGYTVDGLKGLPQAIKTVFPSVNIQTCIVHQIRNSIKYIASKDKKEFMNDLKEVYKATTEELALAQLNSLKEKWGVTLDEISIIFED